MLDPEQHKTIAESPQDLKKKRDPKIPVVFPGGQVKEIECGPHSSHVGGQTILVLLDGVPTIRPRYAKQGYEFYQDMCERTGEMDKWDLWCDMVKERAYPGVKVNFPDECFCEEVRKRRLIRQGKHPESNIDFAERQKEIEKKAKERGKQPIKDRLAGGMKDDVERLEKSASEG